MLKKSLLFLLTLLFAINFTQAQETPICPDDGVVDIVWIPKALDNPVFELGRIGALTRSAELSEALECPVEVLVAAPLSTEAEPQVDLLQEVIALDGIDAIGVSCIDADACIDPINEAIKAGIPTMTWDSDSPDSDRITYLGVDNYEGGRAAADLLIRVMGEKGKVALLSGNEGSQNLDARVQGFLDYVADYPDIEVVEIVYSNDSTSLAVQQVEEVMEEHPDLTGWFFVGLWPFLEGRGAMPVWEEATLAGDVYNVAFDTLPLELDLMEDGFIQGLVGQKYWGWGYDTVQMLVDDVLLGTEYESFTDSGMDIVTPLNLPAMRAAWENCNFTVPLPDPFELDPDYEFDEADYTNECAD